MNFCSAVGGDSEAADESRLLQSMKMTIWTVNRDLPAYRFVCDSDKAVQIQPGCNGRRRAARDWRSVQFGIQGSFAVLQGGDFERRPVMDRLCLAGPMIVVYPEDPSR
jgi:hypothetical protein